MGPFRLEIKHRNPSGWCENWRHQHGACDGGSTGLTQPLLRKEEAETARLFFKISKTLFYFHSLPLTEKNLEKAMFCFTKIMHLPEKKTLN